MTDQEEAIAFYDMHYDVIGQWSIRPGNKVMLGDLTNRRCRFCGKTSPEVTFNKVAHAIPESLGNKSLESAYECDACNALFGQGIENDLGNWSKPMRTLARIRGKSGVPTLAKNGRGPKWRIEVNQGSLNVTAYESDPVFDIDEEKQQIIFTLKRDAYTPVAVLKAFMKMGLTLMPEIEIGNFAHAIAWVTSLDHLIPIATSFPILYTFQPGPAPNDFIAAFILRRKEGISNVPYAFFVLAYGNEVFQLQLPSAMHDRAMNGVPVALYRFPAPESPDPARYGEPRRGILNLTGREVLRNQEVKIAMHFDTAKQSGAPLQDANPDDKSSGAGTTGYQPGTPTDHTSGKDEHWKRTDRLAGIAIVISVFALVATAVATIIAYKADERTQVSDANGVTMAVGATGDRVQLLAQEAEWEGTMMDMFVNGEVQNPTQKSHVYYLESDFLQKGKLPDLKVPTEFLMALTHTRGDASAKLAECAASRDELEGEMEKVAAVNINDWTAEQTETVHVLPYRLRKLSTLCTQAEKSLSKAAPGVISNEPLRGTLGEAFEAQDERMMRDKDGFKTTLQLGTSTSAQMPSSTQSASSTH